MNIAPIEIELVDSMGSDINVVNAARVSFAKQVYTFDVESDQRLLNYLAKHGHWSPFAHTCVTIRCKVPLALARQLVKHQVGGNWNEESRRYIDSEPEFWMPTELHNRPQNAKQGCADTHNYSRGYLSAMEEHSQMSLELYNEMLKVGIAPEEARLVLPLNTMTNIVWTGSILFFHRVWQQRSDSHAQTFAREFAEKLKPILEQVYPHSVEALCQ
jgi:thymidylate synthase (FAD)